MSFLYLLMGISVIITIRLLRLFATRILFNRFSIICRFKGLLGIEEFSFTKTLKDLISKKMRLNVKNLKIRYLNGFRFIIQVESIDISLTLSLIRIEMVQSFVCDNDKISSFLYNVLQLRGKIIRLRNR